jgi:hypothetical protein
MAVKHIIQSGISVLAKSEESGLSVRAFLLMISYMNRFRNLLNRLRRVLRKGPAPPAEPHDPYVGVREPVRKGPPDRSGAVALEEPQE